MVIANLKTSLLWGVLVLVALTLACSDDNEDPDVTSDTLDSTADSTPGDTGDADQTSDVPVDTAVDTPDTPDPVCTGTIITVVRGTVNDADGMGIEAAKAQSCVRNDDGVLRCLRANDTDASGRFATSVPFDAQCMESLTLRALKTDQAMPTVYCQVDVPAPGGSPILVVPDAIVLREATPVPMLEPEGNGMVRTVDFDGIISMDVEPARLQYSGGAYEDLAAISVDPTSPDLCFLDGSSPDHVIGFYPEANVDGPGFPFTVPNTTGLDPDTPVDFYVLGGLDCRTDNGGVVHEGQWEPFGNGTVSSDGATIQSDDGLPCLTWLGIAASP